MALVPAIWHNQNVQIFQYQSGQLQFLKNIPKYDSNF